MRKRNLTTKFINEIRYSAPKGSGINGKYDNIRISNYSKPTKKVLPHKNNEDRIIFENTYDHIYKERCIPLEFRVVIGADETVYIHFLNTTRNERYIIQREGLREYLQEVFEDYLKNNLDFWELFAKIYIRE